MFSGVMGVPVLIKTYSARQVNCLTSPHEMFLIGIGSFFLFLADGILADGQTSGWSMEGGFWVPRASLWWGSIKQVGR